MGPSCYIKKKSVNLVSGKRHRTASEARKSGWGRQCHFTPSYKAVSCESRYRAFPRAGRQADRPSSGEDHHGFRDLRSRPPVSRLIVLKTDISVPLFFVRSQFFTFLRCCGSKWANGPYGVQAVRMAVHNSPSNPNPPPASTPHLTEPNRTGKVGNVLAAWSETYKCAHVQIRRHVRNPPAHFGIKHRQSFSLL